MPKKGGKKKKGPDFETTGWSRRCTHAPLTHSRALAGTRARGHAGMRSAGSVDALRIRSCDKPATTPAPDGLPLACSTPRRRGMPALWVCCKRCNHHAFRYRGHRDRGKTCSKAGSSGGPGRRRRWSRAHRRGRRGEGGRRKTAREWHNVGIISRRLSGALVCAFAPCALAGFWAPWFEGPCVWFCGPPLTCTPSLPPSPCLSPASLQTVAVTPEDSAGI